MNSDIPVSMVPEAVTPPALVASAAAYLRAQRQALMVFLMVLVFSAEQALAQVIQPGGNNRPDEVVNTGICGPNGLLSWLTGTKLIAVMLAVSLVGFFIGRFFGRGGAQEGLIGGGIAVLGIAAIKAITGIFVAGC